MSHAEFVNDLRELPTELHDLEDYEVVLIREAADMLEFFFHQLQSHSLRMDGRHGYRFRGGWPMTHCRGPNKLAAVRAAVAEIRKVMGESDD